MPVDGLLITKLIGSINAELTPVSLGISIQSTGFIALSSAQLIAGVPGFIASPGAGKGILPVGIILDFVFGTTAYVDSGGSDFWWNVAGDFNDTGLIANAQGAGNFVFQSLANVSLFGGYAGGTVLNDSLFRTIDNGSLDFRSSLITGDGTCKVNILYLIVPTV